MSDSNDVLQTKIEHLDKRVMDLQKSNELGTSIKVEQASLKTRVGIYTFGISSIALALIEVVFGHYLK